MPNMASQDSERLKRVRAVHDSLGRTGTPWVPMHVLFRVSALVADEDIVFGDAKVDRQDLGRQVSGEVVVFTATRVVHAVFLGSEADDEPSQGRATVDCASWARSRLKAVLMESDEYDGVMVEGTNEDYGWHHEWDSIVPPGAQLALRYADDRTLLLPCDAREGRAARLDAFLPSLLRDIA